MAVATIKDLKRPVVTAERKTGIGKLLILSKENIARRKDRENGTSDVVSPQSPLTEDDMKPHLPEYFKTADHTIRHIDDTFELLETKFNGVELYAITKEKRAQSVAQVVDLAFQASATQEIANVMLKNLDARKIFADKLVKVRTACVSGDVATLVDELIEFSKFFDTELWSKLNILTESVWDKTGFALGRFTTDFHLQWMRLLKDPFVESVMRAVAEAAKSLAGYRGRSEEFVRQRKEIEQKIGENPVLEKLRQELMALYAEYDAALAECERLTAVLKCNQDNPRNAVAITEAEVQAARELANELDYKVQQMITKYYSALEATITLDQNADSAKLPGHAIQLHVRVVGQLFCCCGRFILDTADFFAAKQLLVAANKAAQLNKTSVQLSNNGSVKKDMRKLDKIKVGMAIDSPGSAEPDIAKAGKSQNGVASAMVARDDSKKKTISGIAGDLDSETVDTRVKKAAESTTNLDTTLKNFFTRKPDELPSTKVYAPNDGTLSKQETIWVCFEYAPHDLACSACNKPLRSGDFTARPHWPCVPPYTGPKEVIPNGDDERTVVSGIHFCKTCFEESFRAIVALRGK